MNADLRKTNRRHRHHRRPLWCFLPRLAWSWPRRRRDRRVVDRLVQRGLLLVVLLVVMACFVRVVREA